MAQPTLRDCQIASIDRVLSLNSSHRPPKNTENESSAAGQLSELLTEDGEPIWKVLVFDDVGCSIISSIMHVADLRKRGVTSHLHIKHNRTPIPDVPVIYLVDPTVENIERICTDLEKGLYSPAHINFLQSIPRDLLELLACRVAETATAEHVAQVYDQYLNFIVSEPDLFSLGLGAGVFWKMNSATRTESMVEEIVDKVVSGLFSVATTMGSIPIIRCPKGGTAAMVAARLDRKLRDHLLRPKDNLFSTDSHRATGLALQSRPVLIIVDRDLDLVPMLLHSWTYLALINDILEFKLNSITIRGKADSGPGTKTVYSIDSRDKFWRDNTSSTFVEMTKNVDDALKSYKSETEELESRTGGSSIEELAKNTAPSTQHLIDVVQKIPALQEKGAIVDKHMAIAVGLLNGIQTRQLDVFYEKEGEVMNLKAQDVLEIIKGSRFGNNPVDKCRFFLIWYLSTNQPIEKRQLDEFESALKEAGVDITSLPFIKKVREQTRKTMMASSATTRAPARSSTNFLSSFSGGLMDRLKDAGLGSSIEGIIPKFANFMTRDTDFTLTKVVESIMEPQSANSSAIAKTEAYLYFDPRSANARGILPTAGQHLSSGPSGTTSSSTAAGPGDVGLARGIDPTFGQKRQGFSEAIVFTVGGGSLEEYGNLQEWVKRKNGSTPGRLAGTIAGPSGGSKKRVVYGSTELITPSDFVNVELNRLGAELSGVSSPGS